MKKLSPEALTVLGSMEIQGKFAAITAGQLDRAVYLEVNKALGAIGGVWTRKAKAHSFKGDPRDALDQIVLTGGFCDKKQEFGFFETPVEVADQLVALAGIEPGMLVLEPSAGRGRLIDAIGRATPRTFRVPEISDEPFIGSTVMVMAVDADPKNADWLRGVYRSDFVRVIHADFLAWRPDQEFLTCGVRLPVDRVVMNPPFSRQADIDHVTHAYSLLAPGGRLVSVMSAGVMFRENKKTEALLALNPKIAPLPDGAFKESGTDVRTCIVTLEKP